MHLHTVRAIRPRVVHDKRTRRIYTEIIIIIYDIINARAEKKERLLQRLGAGAAARCMMHRSAPIGPRYLPVISITTIPVVGTVSLYRAVPCRRRVVRCTIEKWPFRWDLTRNLTATAYYIRAWPRRTSDRPDGFVRAARTRREGGKRNDAEETVSVCVCVCVRASRSREEFVLSPVANHRAHTRILERRCGTRLVTSRRRPKRCRRCL